MEVYKEQSRVQRRGETDMSRERQSKHTKRKVKEKEERIAPGDLSYRIIDRFSLPI
jgi:hypothetical protein